MPTIHRARSVLAVQHLARATRYFIDVLGFTEDDIASPGWSFLSLDRFHVMLGDCPNEMSAEASGNHAWFIHLIVDDVDRYHAEIRARGAEVLTAPTDRTYGLRECLVRTPDGHRLMFAQTIGSDG